MRVCLPRSVYRRPKLGQHFLRDIRYAERAVEWAALRPTDTVLEVGPGKGVLTRLLAPRVAKLVAVELDPELAAGIAAAALQNLELLRGDAVQVDLPAFDACVSNLPYQISSPFLFRLLERDFRVAVLMVQKEFADRLVAKVGTSDYGRLSVNAQRRADVELLTRVPPGAFDPPPKVDSAIVRITPRAPAFDVPPNYDAVVERAFAQRRKKLSNSLGSKDIPYADERPEDIAPAQFAEVARALGRRV